MCRKFPGLSNEKLKQGVFDGPQIRQLIKDSEFVNSMTEPESIAWKSFVLVVKNFLDNHKAENFEALVETMLINFHDLGANMSIKVHYLFSHLDRFLKIWETLARSKEKDSTKILKPWRKDIKVGGMTT